MAVWPFAAGSWLHAQTQALAAPRITQEINESSMVTLRGAVSPLANAQNDVGPASQDMRVERIQLALQSSPQQESDLQQLINDMTHSRLGELPQVAQPGSVWAAVRSVRPGYSNDWKPGCSPTASRWVRFSRAREFWKSPEPSPSCRIRSTPPSTNIRWKGNLHYANADAPQIQPRLRRCCRDLSRSTTFPCIA